MTWAMLDSRRRSPDAPVDRRRRCTFGVSSSAARSCTRCRCHPASRLSGNHQHTRNDQHIGGKGRECSSAGTKLIFAYFYQLTLELLTRSKRKDRIEEIWAQTNEQWNVYSTICSRKKFVKIIQITENNTIQVVSLLRNYISEKLQTGQFDRILVVPAFSISYKDSILPHSRKKNYKIQAISK